SLITVLPSGLEVCIRDAGVGIFVGPEEVINQIADLSITKTVTPNQVVTGSNLTYTIRVTNNGPDTATNVKVSDNLPASTTFVSCVATNSGVCGGSAAHPTATFDFLAPGAPPTLTLLAKVNFSLTHSP